MLASEDTRQSLSASTLPRSPMDEMISNLLETTSTPTEMDRLVGSIIQDKSPPGHHAPIITLTPSQEVLSRRISEKYRIDPVKVSSIVDIVHQESKEKGVDPILVLSIIATESSFNPRARSKVGALGLMQAMPRYHQEKLDRWGMSSQDLYNPHQNIRIGTEILSEYMEISRGNTTTALQRYNGSLSDKSRRYSNKVFRVMAWLSSP